jgi:hypothetical protein
MKKETARRTGKSLRAVRLSGKLEKNLRAYASAAGATGVSLLAVTNVADAKIIYTKIHHVIPPHHNFLLDLHKKGITDFLIANKSTVTYYNFSYDRVYVNPARANSFVGVRSQASALPSGSRVGAGAPFYSGHVYSRQVFGTMAVAPIRTSGSGPWFRDRGKTRYLGLKFSIKGQYHYGWARVRVSSKQGKYHLTFEAVLTGYAYETIPGKPIVTGKTHDNNAPAASRPASLGALAAGASAIPAWRTKERK